MVLELPTAERAAVYTLWKVPKGKSLQDPSVLCQLWFFIEKQLLILLGYGTDWTSSYRTPSDYMTRTRAAHHEVGLPVFWVMKLSVWSSISPLTRMKYRKRKHKLNEQVAQIPLRPTPAAPLPLPWSHGESVPDDHWTEAEKNTQTLFTDGLHNTNGQL